MMNRRLLPIFGTLLLLLAGGCSSTNRAPKQTTDSSTSSSSTTTSTTTETDLPCIPRAEAPTMPETALEYAAMCEPYVGLPPTVDCAAGVRIPIHVDGVEVFEDQPNRACDNTDFKGNCIVGSRIGRVEGVAADGTPLPDVVWVYFCRSAGQAMLDRGVVSVQMIGYNQRNGATCFFESPDAVGDDAQSDYLSFDDQGLLVGTLPGPDSAEFDRAFMPPGDTQCVSCHQNDPFLHDPWIDGARLPSDPTQPVLPELATPDSPYWVIAGQDWDMRTAHMEGNACTACHRVPLETASLLAFGGIHVNEFMPPHAPGTLSEDYGALFNCYLGGPDAPDSPCDWVWPPGLYCEEEADLGGGGGPGTTDTGTGSASRPCADDFDPSASCEPGDKCQLKDTWWVCMDNGTWRSF